jgi:hypothetical protein
MSQILLRFAHWSNRTLAWAPQQPEQKPGGGTGGDACKAAINCIKDWSAAWAFSTVACAGLVSTCAVWQAAGDPVGADSFPLVDFFTLPFAGAFFSSQYCGEAASIFVKLATNQNTRKFDWNVLSSSRQRKNDQNEEVDILKLVINWWNMKRMTREKEKMERNLQW